ncbi:PDC sensor domain-containing protein [Thiovibrio sp. JS02]
MKKGIVAGVVAGAMLFTAGVALAGEKAPQKVVDLANGELVNLGADPVVVEAVKAENAKGKKLDQVKDFDKKWQAAAGVVDYMQALMNSPCGKRLKEIQKSAPYYAEIFVMDNLGGNVCMTDKTSDYWQGDEPKFTESYKGGTGAVHISDVKFDDSTQAYVVQVSVPVKDGAATIGAITFGIDVDKLK